MVGKSGYVKLGVEVGKPKNENNKDDCWDDKNRITDFKKSAPGTVKAEDVKASMSKPKTKKQTEDDLSDGIPF